MGSTLAGRVTAGARYAFLGAFGLLMAAPLLFAGYVSLLRPEDHLRLVGIDCLTLDNYRYVVEHAPIVRWYLNTAFVTGAVTLGAVIVNTLAGYALARLPFRGRRGAFLVVLAVLMVPLQAYLIPLYLLLAGLGWLDSYAALIIPFVVNPFLIFLIRQAASTLPVELEDAAAVDGAGRFVTFLRIGVPLLVTAIATQAILAATWTWNSFMAPVTFTTDRDLYVLTVGLNSIQSQFYTLPTVQMAGVVLLTIPVVAMFLIFQRYVVPSLATTGIRG